MHSAQCENGNSCARPENHPTKNAMPLESRPGRPWLVENIFICGARIKPCCTRAPPQRRPFINFVRETRTIYPYTICGLYSVCRQIWQLNTRSASSQAQHCPIIAGSSSHTPLLGASNTVCDRAVVLLARIARKSVVYIYIPFVRARDTSAALGCL